MSEVITSDFKENTNKESENIKEESTAVLSEYGSRGCKPRIDGQ